MFHSYPLVNSQFAIEATVIEIVDLPIKNGDFPWLSNSLPEAKIINKPSNLARPLLTKEGEDEGALVCEFGAMKRGLATMIPGESRRFWISSEVQEPTEGWDRDGFNMVSLCFCPSEIWFSKLI